MKFEELHPKLQRLVKNVERGIVPQSDVKHLLWDIGQTEEVSVEQLAYVAEYLLEEDEV